MKRTSTSDREARRARAYWAVVEHLDGMLCVLCRKKPDDGVIGLFEPWGSGKIRGYVLCGACNETVEMLGRPGLLEIERRLDAAPPCMRCCWPPN